MDISAISTEMWIGIVAFVIGLVLIFGAAFRKQAGFKMNPIMAGVVGVMLVVFGGAVGIMPLLPETDATTDQIIINSGVTATEPAFTLETSNGTSNKANLTAPTVSSDYLTVTVPLSVTEPGELKASVYTCLNFSLVPIPPTGANADTLATVYFETDYLMKYGGEYVLEETSDTYWANWTYASGTGTDVNTIDYGGSMTMLMTESGWCQIEYKMDDAADKFGDEIDTIGDTGGWDVTFHNADWTWSETVRINWIAIDV